jgi:hypothetical protein
MHNLLAYDRRWLDEPHTGDHLGRTAWALGEIIAIEPPTALLEPSRDMLVDMLPVLAEQRSPRTMAFTMLGLARAGRAAIGHDVLGDLAERLAAQQHANASDGWQWPEDVLAYDNARLPQSLIAAGRALSDDSLVQTGLRSLEWYATQVEVSGSHLELVGHRGRRRGDPNRPDEGEEQPLDAAALVEAEVEAFTATGSDVHALRALRAFEWFLGRNRLEKALYDFATGGCHDGLGQDGVNRNQGAESTLAYLQALLALDVAGLRATLPE